MGQYDRTAVPATSQSASCPPAGVTARQRLSCLDSVWSEARRAEHGQCQAGGRGRRTAGPGRAERVSRREELWHGLASPAPPRTGTSQAWFLSRTNTTTARSINSDLARIIQQLETGNISQLLSMIFQLINSWMKLTTVQMTRWSWLLMLKLDTAWAVRVCWMTFCLSEAPKINFLCECYNLVNYLFCKLFRQG